MTSTASRSLGLRAPSAYAINTSSDTTDTTGLHCRGRLSGRPIDCLVDRQPSPGQSAHHSADRYPQNFGRLLIGEAIHTYQSDQHAMLRRKLLEAPKHFGKLQPVFHDRASVATDQHVDGIDIDRLTAELVRPLTVEPKVLRDPKHPAVQARSRLPLIPIGQSTRTGLLHKIVTLICISR